MIHRNTPCIECRKHRRKCIRDSMEEDTCSRCKRLQKDCIISDDTSNRCLSYSENAKSINREIEYLNSAIVNLENQINLLKSNDSNDNSSDNNDDDDNNDKSIVHYQDGNILTSNWTLTIQSGALRIETGIKNIGDLLLHCPSIQYLSPFQKPTEEGVVIQFRPGKDMCLRSLASKLLIKYRGANMEDNDRPMSFLSLPTSFLFDTKSVIDQFIDIYFQCHNTFHPLIHEPSFMRYYKQLDNPLDSLVCLCICCYVCGAPCEHIHHSFGDRIGIGKYLAGLAKLKLMDQFDLEEKRIENIVSINLLVYYLHTLLLNNECKKFLTISNQIAISLIPWYKKECQKEIPSIECTLYSRNVSSLMTYQKSMGLLIKNRSILYYKKCLPWMSLPDESDELVCFVNAQNWLVKLYNHSFMSKLKSRTRYIFSGDVCTLPFEMIVRLDDVVNEWWRSLPEKYRICDDWLDLEQCRTSIYQCTNGVALITFINFIIYMLSVYSLMLQPKLAADNTVLSIVERLTLNRSLYCCQIVMCGFERSNRLDKYTPCRYSLAMKRYLFHIADVLITLSSSSNQTIKEEARTTYESCINSIESMSFMRYHKVDPSISPLLSKSHISPRELSDINLSVYFSFPQPWYALIYDMCRYLNSNRLSQNDL